MRPRTLDEIVGQTHLLAPGALRRLAAGEPMSVFLWGPPGTGKTTIAAVVSRQTDSRFVELSAGTAGSRRCGPCSTRPQGPAERKADGALRR